MLLDHDMPMLAKQMLSPRATLDCGTALLFTPSPYPEPGLQMAERDCL